MPPVSAALQSAADSGVTPELVVGSSRYAVSIQQGGSATVIINGTIIPFAPTPITLFVLDPNNATSAIHLNATSYSFGAEVSLDKAGTWRVYAEVPSGSYYNRTVSNNVTIAVAVQQPSDGIFSFIVAAAGAAVAAAIITIAIIKKRK